MNDYLFNIHDRRRFNSSIGKNIMILSPLATSRVSTDIRVTYLFHRTYNDRLTLNHRGDTNSMEIETARDLCSPDRYFTVHLTFCGCCTWSAATVCESCSCQGGDGGGDAIAAVSFISSFLLRWSILSPSTSSLRTVRCNSYEYDLIYRLYTILPCSEVVLWRSRWNAMTICHFVCTLQN